MKFVSVPSPNGQHCLFWLYIGQCNINKTLQYSISVENNLNSACLRVNVCLFSM